MNIRVEFTGQLRTAIGQADEQVEVPEGATVAMLLEQLVQRCGDQVRMHVLDASRQPQPSLLVAINGTALPSRQAASTALHEGDAVVLLPPIAGG